MPEPDDKTRLISLADAAATASPRIDAKMGIISPSFGDDLTQGFYPPGIWVFRSSHEVLNAHSGHL